MHRVGERVGAYALLREVKRSSEAWLWLAERADGKSRGPAAVAIRLARSGEARARLEREYQRLVAVGPRNAPRTVGFVAGHDEGSAALSTEWIPGLDLIEIMRARDQGAVVVDMATALELTLRLIRALTPIHSRDANLIHGAIWADQIRFDAHGEMLLTGWGNWNPPGGSDWEAPELAGGVPVPATDAWGVGRLALQLLVSPHEAGLSRTGRLSFLQKAHPAVGRWVSGLLAADPARRPALTGLVERDVLALQRQLGGVADVIGLLNNTREWLIERRLDAGPSDTLDLFRPTAPGGPAWMGERDRLPHTSASSPSQPPPPPVDARSAPPTGANLRVAPTTPLPATPAKEAPAVEPPSIAPGMDYGVGQLDYVIPNRSNDWSDVAPIAANIHAEKVSPVEVEATDGGFDPERAFFEEPITEENLLELDAEQPEPWLPKTLDDVRGSWGAMTQTERMAAAMIGALLLALLIAVLKGLG